MKLSSELRINCWRLYEISANVNRKLAVLSIHVLNALNAHISATDVKLSSDAHWMSVRLKKEIKLVFMIM